MFVAIEDPTADYTDSKWFRPPFGFATQCKPLEDWKRTTFYKQITTTWSESVANQVLDDYTRTVQEWLDSQVRKKQGRRSIESIFPPNFKLSDDGQDAQELKSLTDAKSEDEDTLEKLRVATLKRDLTAALLYFATYILDPALQRSLWAQYHISQSENDQGVFTWKNARDVITWGLKAEDPLVLLTKLLTVRRDDRMTLYRWIAHLRSLRVRLEKVEVTLPESFYLKLTNRQMMSSEHRLMESWTSTLDEDQRETMSGWYKAAQTNFDVATTPVFRIHSIKQELAKIPEILSKSDRTHKGQTRTPKAGDDGVPTLKHNKSKGNKKSHEDPKSNKQADSKQESPTLRRSGRKTTQKGCYRCGGSDHKGPKDPQCPHHIPREQWLKKKREGKKRETFVLEEVNPPPSEEVGHVEEQSFVLADFAQSSPFPIHHMQCHRFWMAKAGHTDWDVSGFKKCKWDMVQNRSDCNFNQDCCGSKFPPRAHRAQEKMANDSTGYSDDCYETWMIKAPSTPPQRRPDICKAKLDILDSQEKIRTITVALDTGANRDLCLSKVLYQVTDRSTSQSRVCGGLTRSDPWELSKFKEDKIF